MASPATPTSSNSAPDAFSAVQFPLDEPVTDVEEAARELEECPNAELRRARKHHRRALKALRDGGYEALSEGTRERLLEQFHLNLEALNTALNASTSEKDASSRSRSTRSSFSFRSALTWLW